MMARDPEASATQARGNVYLAAGVSPATAQAATLAGVLDEYERAIEERHEARELVRRITAGEPDPALFAVHLEHWRRLVPLAIGAGVIVGFLIGHFVG